MMFLKNNHVITGLERVGYLTWYITARRNKKEGPEKKCALRLEGVPVLYSS